MNPIALREPEARKYLGVTEYVFKQLKKKGIVKRHPLTLSYRVVDLDRVLQSEHEDGQNQENHAAGRNQEAAVQIRRGSRGKAGRGSQAPHPLDA